jgi:hypothetical protein
MSVIACPSCVVILLEQVTQIYLQPGFVNIKAPGWIGAFWFLEIDRITILEDSAPNELSIVLVMNHLNV